MSQLWRGYRFGFPHASERDAERALSRTYQGSSRVGTSDPCVMRPRDTLKAARFPAPLGELH